MTMLGIPLGSVTCLTRKPPKDAGVTVHEPPGESLYEKIFVINDKPRRRTHLTAFSFDDLGLKPYCQTKDIYAQATDIEGEIGAEIVPYSVALQIPAELPSLFCPSFIDTLCGKKLPFRKCLIGVEPMSGSNGQQYVIELSENIFSFRRASPFDEWPDDVWWVFATES